jgi:hypothetical protein
MRMAPAPVDNVLMRPSPATPDFGLLMESFQPATKDFASERPSRCVNSIDHHNDDQNW